ncbi:MAG TPA: choice-of-anchor tandem repeat GloVer-containing protein [Acetobacteraceae bacterium]|nr:choice-of-anchor tandem repeat GloVer-containing protein [Acetobacteraceae bacterium]
MTAANRRTRHPRLFLRLCFGALFLARGLGIAWADPTFTTIFEFPSGGTRGSSPESGVIVGPANSLYGTTDAGGVADGGVVYQLTPPANPKHPWKQTIIHRFQTPEKGGYPLGLALATTGELFGVTFDGGAGNGTVFRLRQEDVSSWKFTLLHSFAGGDDGALPSGALIFDRHIILDGQSPLIGATDQGGAGAGQPGAGVVFTLVPPQRGKGPWREFILYRFGGSPDGATPQAPLLAKGGHTRFGVTTSGGTGICGNLGCGTIFEINQVGHAWSESAIYDFQGGADGSIPVGNLIADGHGRLYGVTSMGGLPGPQGNYETGTVFRLDPPTSQQAPWTKEILYHFQGGADGYSPLNGVLRDKTGALYGTTYEGGTGRGTLFKLTPGPRGQDWTKTILHNFVDGSGDGALPTSSLVTDGTGSIYGTTVAGGASGNGTVFRLVP